MTIASWRRQSWDRNLRVDTNDGNDMIAPTGIVRKLQGRDTKEHKNDISVNQETGEQQKRYGCVNIPIVLVKFMISRMEIELKAFSRKFREIRSMLVLPEP